jgi:predicted PurR-regulated permease PerM
MNTASEAALETLKNRLPLLLVAVTLALGWILWPFFGVILWGAIIALLFRPVHRQLLLRLGQRRNLAALLTLFLALFIVIFPMVGVAAALAKEAAQLYQRLQSGDLEPVRYLQGVYDGLPHWFTVVLDQFGLGDFNTLQNRVTEGLTKGSEYFATQAFNLGQNTFEFVASIFITLYLTFFLIRDGDQLGRDIRQAIPLAPAHKHQLINKFTTVILATIKGSVVVAAIQGVLGGLAFWYLGVGAPLLWAVLMAFLSLLPAVGAGLVWVPVAIYFLVTGATLEAVALTAYGVLVIGLVDNLLRPRLMGKQTRMPDYMVMISTLGGMAVFGLNGFVIGPLIAAMFIAAWHLYGVVPETPDAGSRPP